MWDASAEIFFWCFFVGGRLEQFWRGQECPFFDVHAALPLLTMVSPTLHCALKDGFGAAVMAHDMPKPCEFAFLDSC